MHPLGFVEFFVCRGLCGAAVGGVPAVDDGGDFPDTEPLQLID